ncbi:hypothetical protein [Kitasatospora sp. DSM 101779]|uniref:hypothetical protein n=1 Tax=Kitasatospora sp. DSM 101779 TaxID=2853165 RepID=UPI0021DA3A00|nr:hypothetical protein [Kitasatospora sp. DSM 101779]MCU7827099.1 hypothetical protein [Kitasatospora sp. DSM 101779]
MTVLRRPLRLPGITEAAHVTGGYGHLLRARASAAVLDRLLRRQARRLTSASCCQSDQRVVLRDARRRAPTSDPVRAGLSW